MTRYTVLASVLLSISVVSVAHGGMSPLDINYFAFMPTRPFAVKISGQWVKPDFALTLGAEPDPGNRRASGQLGCRFVLDLRQAKGVVPASCQQRFTTPINDNHMKSTMAAGSSESSDTQGERFAGAHCTVTLWLTGKVSYQFQHRFESSAIEPPQDKSVSFAKLEIRADSGTSELVFAIPVEDVSNCQAEAVLLEMGD